MEISITRIDEDTPDALYCQYPGNNRPQPVHLALDLEDGELTADYNAEPGDPDSHRPESVYYSRTLWFAIPTLTAAAANTLMDEIAPIAQRILAGSEIERDGNGIRRGVLDDSAQMAREELEVRLEPTRFDDSQTVSAWDADDWFAGEGRDEVIRRFDVTSDMTDDRIAALAAEEVEDAKTSGVGYVVLDDDDVVRYLAGLREDLRETEREALEQVAKDLASMVTLRNTLIRRLSGWGDSSRAIGNRAGMSHAWVQDLAKSQTRT